MHTLQHANTATISGKKTIRIYKKHYKKAHNGNLKPSYAPLSFQVHRA